MAEIVPYCDRFAGQPRHYGQFMDLTRGVDKEHPINVREAIEKVSCFVDKLYDGVIPPRLGERLALLNDPQKIIVDTTEMLRVRREDRPEESESEKERMNSGFFDSRRDQIFLRSDASRETVVHEVLHFISAVTLGKYGVVKLLDPATKEDIVDFVMTKLSPNQFDATNRKTNEALTILLTQAIDGDIDITGPAAFYDLYRYYQVKKDSGESYLSDSYDDYLFNVLEFFRLEIDNSGLLPEIAKEYLMADREGFEMTLYRRSLDLLKISHRKSLVADKFYAVVNQEGKEAGLHLVELFDNVANRFLSDERLDLAFGEFVKEFIRALHNRNINIRYIHPENNRDMTDTEFISITPELRGGSSREPLSININTRLLDYITPIIRKTDRGEVGKEPFAHLCQIEAFMLWQGIKLKQLKDEGIFFDTNKQVGIDKTGIETESLTDIEVYQHPIMRDYLSRLTVSEFVAVVRALRLFIGFTPNEEDVLDIFQKRAAHFGDLAGFIEVPLSNEEELITSMKKNNVTLSDTFCSPSNGAWYIPQVDLDTLERLNS